MKQVIVGKVLKAMPGAKKCFINISCVPGATVIAKASALERMSGLARRREVPLEYSLGTTSPRGTQLDFGEWSAGHRSCRKQTRVAEELERLLSAGCWRGGLDWEEWVSMAGCRAG